MIDCAQVIRNYHDDAVKLTEETRRQLRANRNANRDRLEDNLKANERPSPVRFQKQGSYAMRTTIQEAENAYDIDDGVAFKKDDLNGVRGGQMSALDARQMVCDALQDKRFKKKPEVLKNCVRVHYNEGYHVDIPVYRETDDERTGFTCEIASSEWRESDPAEINAWFDRQLAKKRSTQDDDDHQMRRMIRLLKRYAKSRPSWNLPSGFILTILADEQYLAFDDRDDRAFYNLIVAIGARVRANGEVRNPVQDEVLTKGTPDPKMRALEEKLREAIGTLHVLFNAKCTRTEALKAWAKVFNTDYFDGSISDAGSRASIVVGTGTPTAPVQKSGGGRFG